MIVQTLSHAVTSDDPAYDDAAARNVYINADQPAPVTPTEPTGPTGPAGPTGDAGAAGAVTALARTGGHDLSAWALWALVLTALGVALTSASRRRRHLP